MKLTKRGPNTITSKKALREELDEIQAAGFAVDDQELAAELYAIAAPGAQRGPRRRRRSQPGRVQRR